MDLYIPVLLGTARTARESEKVARWLSGIVGEQEGVSSELVDIKDMGYVATTPPWGEGGSDSSPTQWRSQMEKADGLVIVVPEYNRGYPGELKLAIDSLYTEYRYKPVLVCGVSGGGFGGSRVVEHIQPVLQELKMVFVSPPLYVSDVVNAFNDAGPVDPGFLERAQKSVDPLVKLARVLRKYREDLS